MSHSAARLLYWPPRILAIAFTIFLGLFATDVFNEVHGFWHIALAFSIHLIPALLLVVVLVVAWRWEWVGALLFFLAGARYAWAVLPRHVNWALTIATPLLAIAALFLANWIQRAKVRSAL